MAKPLLSHKRSRAISSALFLVGLAFLLYAEAWWPGIMIVIGIPLALRQLLLGRYHDMIITLLVFLGFFIVAQFNISWKILIPILFIVGAIYILCKEWVESQTTTLEEIDEDLNKEIEEHEDKS